MGSADWLRMYAQRMEDEHAPHNLSIGMREAADEIERLRAEMAGDKILEDCEMHDPVWAAIAGVWGKRCEDFEEGCPCCRAWAEYDKITRLTAENERLLAANRDVMLHWDVLKADYDKLRAALWSVMDDLTLIENNQRLPVGMLDDVIYVNARAALEGK